MAVKKKPVRRPRPTVAEITPVHLQLTPREATEAFLSQFADVHNVEIMTYRGDEERDLPDRVDVRFTYCK